MGGEDFMLDFKEFVACESVGGHIKKSTIEITGAKMADEDATVVAAPAAGGSEALAAPAALVAHLRDVIPLLLGGSEGELSAALAAAPAAGQKCARIFFIPLTPLRKTLQLTARTARFIEDPHQAVLVVKRNVLAKDEGPVG